MMVYDWREGAHNAGCHYFYTKENGLIVGQTYNIAHTNIWVSKIYRSHNDELYLGQYITLEFAKGAVENYFEIQSRTLLEQGL